MFVSYGSRENGAAGRANVEALRQAGIKSVFYESPNTAHEWLTWRRACTNSPRCCSKTNPWRLCPRLKRPRPAALHPRLLPCNRPDA